MKQPITDKLLVVRLSIKSYLGRSKAPDVEQEVESNHNATSGSVSVNVHHLPKEYTKPIQRVSAMIRTWFYTHTLPWEDGGLRVVPVEKYHELKDAIDRMTINEWEPAVTRILDDYHSIKADAKHRLGSLFDEYKFPTQDELDAKFSVEIQTGTISNVDDVRIIGMDAEQVEQIKTEMETRYAEQIKFASDYLLSQVNDVLSDMEHRLSKDPKGVKYKSLLDRVDKLIETAPSLNITKNIDLDNILSGLADSVKDIDSARLKNDEKARKRLLGRAKALLKELRTMKEPAPESYDLDMRDNRPDDQETPQASTDDIEHKEPAVVNAGDDLDNMFG